MLITFIWMRGNDYTKQISPFHGGFDDAFGFCFLNKFIHECQPNISSIRYRHCLRNSTGRTAVLPCPASEDGEERDCGPSRRSNCSRVGSASKTPSRWVAS